MRRSYRIGTSVIGMPFSAHSANRSASSSNPVAVRPSDLRRSETHPHMPLQTSEIGVANRKDASQLNTRLPMRYAIDMAPSLMEPRRREPRTTGDQAPSFQPQSGQPSDG